MHTHIYEYKRTRTCTGLKHVLVDVWVQPDGTAIVSNDMMSCRIDRNEQWVNDAITAMLGMGHALKDVTMLLGPMIPKGSTLLKGVVAINDNAEAQVCQVKAFRETLLNRATELYPEKTEEEIKAMTVQLELRCMAHSKNLVQEAGLRSENELLKAVLSCVVEEELPDGADTDANRPADEKTKKRRNDGNIGNAVLRQTGKAVSNSRLAYTFGRGQEFWAFMTEYYPEEWLAVLRIVGERHDALYEGAPIVLQLLPRIIEYLRRSMELDPLNRLLDAELSTLSTREVEATLLARSVMWYNVHQGWRAAIDHEDSRMSDMSEYCVRVEAALLKFVEDPSVAFSKNFQLDERQLAKDRKESYAKHHVAGLEYIWGEAMVDEEVVKLAKELLGAMAKGSLDKLRIVCKRFLDGGDLRNPSPAVQALLALCPCTTNHVERVFGVLGWAQEVIKNGSHLARSGVTLAKLNKTFGLEFLGNKVVPEALRHDFIGWCCKYLQQDRQDARNEENSAKSYSTRKAKKARLSKQLKQIKAQLAALDRAEKIPFVTIRENLDHLIAKKTDVTREGFTKKWAAKRVAFGKRQAKLIKDGKSPPADEQTLADFESAEQEAQQLLEKKVTTQIYTILEQQWAYLRDYKKKAKNFGVDVPLDAWKHADRLRPLVDYYQGWQTAHDVLRKHRLDEAWMKTARPQVNVMPGGTVSAKRLAIEDALFTEETELKANATAQWKQTKDADHQKKAEKKQQKAVAKKAKADQKLLEQQQKNEKTRQQAGGKPKRKRQPKGSSKKPAKAMRTSPKPTVARGRPRKRQGHELREVERSKSPEKATAQVTRPSRKRRVPEKLQNSGST
jgi:hypothetical protein